MYMCVCCLAQMLPVGQFNASNLAHASTDLGFAVHPTRALEGRHEDTTEYRMNDVRLSMKRRVRRSAWDAFRRGWLLRAVCFGTPVTGTDQSFSHSFVMVFSVRKFPSGRFRFYLSWTRNIIAIVTECYWGILGDYLVMR